MGTDSAEVLFSSLVGEEVLIEAPVAWAGGVSVTILLSEGCFGRPMFLGLASSQGPVLTLGRQQAKPWLSDCSLLSFSRSAQKTALGITPTTFTWTA